MSKISIHSKDFVKETVINYFSPVEVYALRHFHPISLFIESVGLLWFTYYLWSHDWPIALGVVILSKLLSYLAVIDVDPGKMKETSLGKIALLHYHPVNFITQLLGFITFYYGIWWHSLEFMLGGLSIILLGHLFGWSLVDHRFSPFIRRSR